MGKLKADLLKSGCPDPWQHLLPAALQKEMGETHPLPLPYPLPVSCSFLHTLVSHHLSSPANSQVVHAWSCVLQMDPAAETMQVIQAQHWSLFQVVVDDHAVGHVAVSCHLLPLAKGGEAVSVLPAWEKGPVFAGKQSGGAGDVDVVLIIQGRDVPRVQGAVLGCPDAVGTCRGLLKLWKKGVGETGLGKGTATAQDTSVPGCKPTAMCHHPPSFPGAWASLGTLLGAGMCVGHCISAQGHQVGLAFPTPDPQH